MVEQIMVLYARPYSFADKETGQLLEGVTIYYLTNNSVNNNGDGFGYQVIKSSVSDMTGLKVIPGVYDAHFKTVNTSRGLGLKLSKLEFVTGVELWNNEN